MTERLHVAEIREAEDDHHALTFYFGKDTDAKPNRVALFAVPTITDAELETLRECIADLIEERKGV